MPIDDLIQLALSNTLPYLAPQVTRLLLNTVNLARRALRNARLEAISPAVQTIEAEQLAIIRGLQTQLRNAIDSRSSASHTSESLPQRELTIVHNAESNDSDHDPKQAELHHSDTQTAPATQDPVSHSYVEQSILDTLHADDLAGDDVEAQLQRLLPDFLAQLDGLERDVASTPELSSNPSHLQPFSAPLQQVYPPQPHQAVQPTHDLLPSFSSPQEARTNIDLFPRQPDNSRGAEEPGTQSGEQQGQAQVEDVPRRDLTRATQAGRAMQRSFGLEIWPEEDDEEEDQERGDSRRDLVRATQAGRTTQGVLGLDAGPEQSRVEGNPQQDPVGATQAGSATQRSFGLEVWREDDGDGQ
ncbi:hypothetical protein OHC33_000826 [Knufia fluminis]|uniref:Uncharacterized protein n=1 Tax=Knufia fluminis TaxID=191047 RepID=A0AAN8ES34_9EURO|nr:hypothetical protein OHC33_000826 [Knufia fluminis]